MINCLSSLLVSFGDLHGGAIVNSWKDVYSEAVFTELAAAKTKKRKSSFLVWLHSMLVSHLSRTYHIAIKGAERDVERAYQYLSEHPSIVRCCTVCIVSAAAPLCRDLRVGV